MRLNNSKGFTLVELLAALTLSAIVLALIFSVIQSTTRGFQTLSSRESSQEKARLLADQITSEVRRAPHLVSQLTSSGVVLNLAETSGDYMRLTYNSSTKTLTKQVKKGPAAVASNDVATNVKSVTATLANPYSVTVSGTALTNFSKITLNIVFDLPRKQTSTYSTVIYVPSWNQ